MADVEGWKKRIKKKGPFYLLDVEPYPDQVYVDGKWVFEHKGKQRYVVIWNDGPKTKYGSFADGMSARYGVHTWCVLNGDTPYDLWNGAGMDDKLFDQMLAVRKKTSTLPTFDLDEIKGLTW